MVISAVDCVNSLSFASDKVDSDARDATEAAAGNVGQSDTVPDHAADDEIYYCTESPTRRALDWEMER